ATASTKASHHWKRRFWEGCLRRSASPDTGQRVAHRARPGAVWFVPAGKRARASIPLLQPMTSLVRKAQPVAAASLLCLCVGAAPAQVPPFELEPVTVTGSRTPRTLGSEIAATSVLTRADIETQGARDLV